MEGRGWSRRRSHAEMYECVLSPSSLHPYLSLRRKLITGGVRAAMRSEQVHTTHKVDNEHHITSHHIMRLGRWWDADVQAWAECICRAGMRARNATLLSAC